MNRLEELPDRMTALESQILQLRTEMREEFSVVRREIRQEMLTGDEETRRSLREEIRAGDAETRRVLQADIQDLGSQMRVLHEDVISRIALLQEVRPRSTRPKRDPG